MLVQAGSNANTDSATTEASSGRSQARIFSVNALGTSTYSVAYTTGQLVAYGLRNSIGLGEEPLTGGIVTCNSRQLRGKLLTAYTVVCRKLP
jgi:glucose/arabinose dehydrogenase